MKKPQFNSSYFHEACSWADDKFGLLEASRARYQLAFIASISAVMLLALAIITMLPLKKVQTIAVHHYENGVTTVEAQGNDHPPINKAQVESDIVRYVINRESYDDSSYRAQFELIRLLSDHSVAKEFEKQQTIRNPNAPINTLGTKISRQVHVYSINFIDSKELDNQEPKGKQNHHNLAEVVFSTKDHHKTQQQDKEKQFTALVSWRYTKPPESVEQRWKNFDGFEVTRYTRSQRNV